MTGSARNSLIGANVVPDTYPIHGLRVPPMDASSGWFVWTGEYQTADDFFAPLFEEELVAQCPDLAPHLALPPGTRFLLAPGHQDIWHDASLLEIEE